MRFIKRYNSEIYGDYRRSALLYGLLTGGSMALCMLILSLLDVMPGAPENYYVDGVMLIGLFFFSYRYRLRLPEGRVSLKELMLLGVDTGLVASVLYGLLLLVVMKGIMPSWVVSFVDGRLAAMGAPSTELELQACSNVQGMGAADWSFIGGFRTFVMSILFTFFSALVFRTEKGQVAEKKK